MSEDYSPDGFKTLTFRVGRNASEATFEGPSELRYGDSIILVVRGVSGCTPASLVFAFADSDGTAISSSGAWAFVPGTVDAVYTAASLLTANCLSALDGVSPGDSVPIRAYLSETSGRTFVDCALDLYPNPTVSGTSATPSSYYPTKAQLAEIADAVLANPMANPYQTAERLTQLLNALSALGS